MHVVRQLFLRMRARRIFGHPVAVFGPFDVGFPQNVRMGRNCAINHGVFILGSCGITIGNDVVLSARCMLIDAGLDSNRARSGVGDYRNMPIMIEDGVWIGAGAIILPGVTIGTCSIIGAGSVVTKNIPAHSIAVGNPARVIKSFAQESGV